MKSIRYFFFVAFLAILIEIVIRLSGIYATYAEANFDRYESLYNQARPIYYYEWRKDSVSYDQAEFSITCKVNNFSLRDNKDFKTDTLDHYKILFLGDSFTEGVGASCGKNLPETFQKLLKDSITVYNGGVLGADPFYYLKWYDEKFHVLEPQEVFIVLNYSDISDYIFRGGDERFIGGDSTLSKPAPKIEWWYKNFHTVRFIAHFVFQYDYTLLLPEAFEKQSDEAIIAIANKINEWSFRHPELKLSVVIHPYAFSYSKNVPGHNKMPELRTFFNKNIDFINLYPNFASLLQKENYLDYSWKIDGHFNDKGYDFFAQELWTEWQKQNIIDIKKSE